MPYAFSLSDVAYLRSADGERALAECGTMPLTGATRIADVAALRREFGDRAAAVLETVLLRRKSELKLEAATGWLFTADALQQASASAVARHRAQRLRGRVVHDVTCSIGADLAELAKVARCLGSDIDEVRLAMARHNCPGVPLARADALRPVSRDTVVVADPARRDSAGRRTWRPQDFAPPLDRLAETYAGRDLVVKCAPGFDFAAAPWAGEVEVVSLDGAVRESCLWSEGLATVSRRATVLRGGVPWTITDQEPADVGAGAPGEWIVDPDGAVVRAGLVKHYGARHGLWQLDERIAYLTGDAPPPGVRAFRVLDHGPYGEKSLRAMLRKRAVGRVEILIRGLDLDPDVLRKRLKPAGPGEATVVLTRIGRAPVAFLCEAHRIPG